MPLIDIFVSYFLGFTCDIYAIFIRSAERMANGECEFDCVWHLWLFSLLFSFSFFFFVTPPIGERLWAEEEAQHK